MQGADSLLSESRNGQPRGPRVWPASGWELDSSLPVYISVISLISLRLSDSNNPRLEARRGRLQCHACWNAARS